ncbi:hypothetical protein A5893_14430 [Pedobacter psychrophilus]|uniref:Glycosyltransferase 2-like domain-containing protein n=1 Tax=Pedobacter psychrophilus TaxID=1826909 RepID=A0A179DC33_9SPHI|nr:glycosyltransferase family 2 protein [Pedobacter psychrophilus]OAQ38606.1 hypothetical protein A5893_14430 [Pedobacter psychrophilus]
MKISIITINYNNKIGLERTIKSVTCQDYINIEYIIIDGGSIDGSAEIIDKYKSKINYWISEKDNGIYAAMNKGIAKSTGDYLLFLNSGDIFTSNESIASVFLNPNFKIIDIIYGNLSCIDKDGIVTVLSYPKKLSFEYFIYFSLPHPATFIRKQLFDTYGMYDESLKISSDWKFFLLMICKNNCSYKFIDITLSEYQLDGISSNFENMTLIREEQVKVFVEEFPNIIHDYMQLEQLKSFFDDFKKSKVHRLLSKIGLIRYPKLKINDQFKF